MNEIAACIYNGDIIILDFNSDEFYLVENNGDEIVDKDMIKESITHLGEYKMIFLNLTDACQMPKQHILEERWSPKVPSLKSKNGFLFFFKLIWYGFKLRRISNRIIKDKWDFILNKKPKLKNKITHDKHLIISAYLWLIRKTFYLNNSKTDCIITSVALQHFLAHRGISSVLVLGVKTRPFFAHAWVEVEGVVINDDVNLRKLLSVILEVRL